MTTKDDPGVIHIPDASGRPICGGASGRTSTGLVVPECPACRERTTVFGMETRDAFNPAHPVGRTLMGITFGVPGFPQVPGLWRKFRKD